MKHNLLEDYNNVISIKNKELEDLRAKQSKYNNKKCSLNKKDFFQKEIRKKKEELLTTKKLKHQLELRDINFY